MWSSLCITGICRQEFRIVPKNNKRVYHHKSTKICHRFLNVYGIFLPNIFKALHGLLLRPQNGKKWLFIFWQIVGFIKSGLLRRRKSLCNLIRNLMRLCMHKNIWFLFNWEKRDDIHLSTITYQCKIIKISFLCAVPKSNEEWDHEAATSAKVQNDNTINSCSSCQTDYTNCLCGSSVKHCLYFPRSYQEGQITQELQIYHWINDKVSEV